MEIDRRPSFPGGSSDGAGAVSDAPVAAFLAARYGSQVERLAPLEGGEWSKAYRFDRAGAGYVARFSALEEDFAKDQRAAAFCSRDLPIPRLLEVGTALGGFYAISERAGGDHLDQMGAAAMRALLPSLFAALDGIRLADISATTGYGLWGAAGAAPHPTWRAALLDIVNDRPADRTHGWRQQLVASPTGIGPFDEAFGYLGGLAAHLPEERHLIHSDLLNRNVLVSGERISAVIDWGCALFGDFLYDIAWLCFWSPWYPAWREIDFGREAARHYAAIGLDVPNLEQRLRCYQVHIGLGGQAYNAFKGRWTELEATARRTLAVAQTDR